MKTLTVVLLIVLLAILARSFLFSFRAQAPEHYAATTPAFSITEHLTGPIQSEGVIFGPNGRMTNSFVAQMEGRLEGDQLVLSEDFTYSNGSTQAREWTITMEEDGRFTATADDIIGAATGRVAGAALNLRYRIVLPEAAGGHTLDVNDWLYLTADGVLMNRSEFRKFGIKVGELIATMRPLAE